MKMTKIAAVGLLVCLAVGAVHTVSSSAERDKDAPRKKITAKAKSDHGKWLASSLREMQTIKPGMTRGDLLKVFKEEGGISTRTQQRYVYHGCRYIKVNVTFDAVGSPEDKLTPLPEDRIRKISKPFLEWSIID
ncbi:MAG: hypothetical protein IID44_12290 [Planctomycetes bacterium]|nr:hypothetical protein [Planctomycetota bacterium]